MAQPSGDRFLGIDVGTSSVAAAVWVPGEDRPSAAVTIENDAALPARAPFAEQDPARILATVRRALAAVAAASPGPLAGLACTGQMHGVLLVDDRLDPVTPLATWQDHRAEPAVVEMNAALDRRDPLGQARRGCRLHPGYGGATLAWMVRVGAIPPGARRACTIADWIASRFCGELATDPSHAASWGLFDLERGAWDGAAADALGIPAALLPPARAPATVLGVADLGGLGRQVAVRCGVGDNQASVLAAVHGAPADQCVVVNVGTGSQISVVASRGTGAGRRAGPAIERRPFLCDAVLHVGARLNGGAAYALLRRFFASASAEPDAPSADELYARMEAWARTAPAGCEGLSCDPAFAGERGREDLRGSFRGVTEANLTPGHLTRAVLEGMAGSLHDLYREIGIEKRRIVASGNAVRKNALLREIMAATFGLQLSVSPFEEEAAVGAAMVASGATVGVPTA